MHKKNFLILYWVNGVEVSDGDYSTLDEAMLRFEYLKNHCQDCLPDGVTAIELVDQYFDAIDHFNPMYWIELVVIG